MATLVHHSTKMKSQTIETKSNAPFVVLPLKQYKSMLDCIEELEDRAAVQSRKDEEDVPWESVMEKFTEKFGSR